ncbi:MAG: Asp-tRNA(Asn)/Glu-tRNA(Gln) amidotransferase GatCAB subunit B [Dehalococcoidia bacterium]|nr:Asp-tRNA(Asn)/Glu-tRNA(Gln) amidotransferase GatCAB subunit B [Dehalococcoidia bacterium]
MPVCRRPSVTDAAIQFETVIGLEVHCQPITRSKMFCGCNAEYSGAEPNTHVCPVCLGLPGVLPVINEEAIRLIVKTGLALNCEISEFSKFDRKNYPYPDLMKGYQVSQYDLPICAGGWLDVEVEGERTRVGITRVHMEEDTARLLHRTDPISGEGYSLIDINRSGTPLMEIVSEPDIRSPEEARAYLISLRSILRAIGASRANMEEGNFRCDANISLRPRGQEALGSKVEIKNMNSFRAVYEALVFEMSRQAEVLSEGGAISQETRGWDQDGQGTVSQRSKEEANDYRYFPEPDLPPLALSRQFVEEVRSELPELPAARRGRYIGLGLSEFEASTLAEARDRSDFADAVASALPFEPARSAKLSANWVLGEVGRWANDHDADVEHFPLTPEALAELIEMVEGEIVTGQVGKQVFDEMVVSGRSSGDIVKEDGLAQVRESDELVEIVRKVIAENEKAVADYRGGKGTAIKRLLGGVMRETRGRANPQVAQELISRELDQ